MRPVPPLLLAATLLFWGWQTGLLWLALPLAAALEAPRWVALRLELRTAPLARTFDFGLLGAFVIAGYLITTGSSTQGIVLTLQVLPLTLAPFVLAQAWSVAGGIDLKALWSNRQRRDPPPARPYPVDFRWLYLPVCVVAASAANQRGPLFFGLLGVLGAWALLAARERGRSPGPWLALLLAATLTGYAGQLGLYRLQQAILYYALDFDPEAGADSDPYRNATALGQVGTLKLSDAIVLRLRADAGAPPRLLHRATYDTYAGTTWTARDALLEPLARPPPGAGWQLEPGVEAGARVTLHTLVDGERALLAAPPGATALERLDVAGVRRNRFGALEVTPQADGLLGYRVAYRAGHAPATAAPTAADLAVPAPLQPLLARHRDRLGLDAAAPAEAARRLAQWFAGEFGYSLYQPDAVPGRDALETFLERRRAGHCEYFATATTLLLRSAGIPARYVTGYAVTEWSDLEQAFVVRRRHAHAWSTAYVGGRWIELDTTPATWVDLERQQASALQPLADAWDWLLYRFRAWRQQAGQRPLPAAWALALLPPLLLLAWRARRRLRRPGAAAPAAHGAGRAAAAGADSPFYRLARELEAGGQARAATELVSRWAERTGAGLADPALATALREIVALHYRYRFDPAVDAAAGRAELEARVAAWLAAWRRAAPGQPAATGGRGGPL